MERGEEEKWKEKRKRKRNEKGRGMKRDRKRKGRESKVNSRGGRKRGGMDREEKQVGEVFGRGRKERSEEEEIMWRMRG